MSDPAAKALGMVVAMERAREAQARERVIEECAKVAEEHLDHMDFEKAPEDWQQHHEYPFRCNVAEAIRALKEKRE